MISMLHKAYVETLPSTEEISDETSYALGIAVNLRKIRIPPAAKTFFGNMLTSSVTPFSKGSVLKSSVFDMAVEVRRGIGMLSEEYIQSCIDKLDQLKFYQHYGIIILKMNSCQSCPGRGLWVNFCKKCDECGEFF